jgi:type II secretory pathway pseudopilin PulG
MHALRKPVFATHDRARAGFSLLEASMAILMVGLLMTAALRSVGASKKRESDTADRLLGRQLAAGLMNEILLQAYEEPVAGVTIQFGPETGETTGNRSLFDDVDDYRGWTASPPTDRNGMAINGFSNWSHSVAVAWANPTTYAETSQSYTDLKKITVSVSKNGKPTASVVSYRSKGWVDTIPKPSDATGNHAPVAVANASSTFVMHGQSITLDGSNSTDQDGDTLSYVWNFGNGTTASGKTVSMSYSSTGFYTCTLTVYDGNGGMSTDTVTIWVWF